MFSNLLKLSASIGLLTLSIAAIIVSEEIWQLGIATQKTEVALCSTLSVVPSKLDSVVLEVHTLNQNISASSSAVVAQTRGVSEQIQQTLAAVDTVATTLNASLSHANSVMDSANRVVSNTDIPALLRDTRRTVALTGVTMSHVRQTANVIAEQAPAVGASTVRVADNISGITADVHKITTDISKPKPWWKRTLSYLGDGVKIGGAIF